jgi:hypothetical protein
MRFRAGTGRNGPGWKDRGRSVISASPLPQKNVGNVSGTADRHDT